MPATWSARAAEAAIRCVRGEDGTLRDVPLPFGEHVALDLELLDDGLDRHLALRETRVVEGAREPGHAGAHFARSQPSPGNGLLEDPRGRRVSVRESLRVDVLHPGGKAVVRGELRDPSAHDARAEHPDALDVEGPDVDVLHPAFLFHVLGREIDFEQIALDVAAEDVGDPPALDLERDLGRLAPRLLDHGERLERGRVMAAGLGQDLFAGLAEDDRPAEWRRLERPFGG
jgi:hypothetical protein